jgi:predicted transcriptional regulator
MFNETKKNFEIEVNKFATKNIIKKLEEQGVDYKQLDDSTFNDLVADEIEILKRDSKKIGIGIGIGWLISGFIGI